MTYKHEIMHLNSSCVYLRVNDTWYDASNGFTYEIGDPFLIGRVEEILSYEEYTERFPESKNEMAQAVSEKTTHKGYLRKPATVLNPDGTKSRVVQYAVNPKQLIPFDKLEFDVYD